MADLQPTPVYLSCRELLPVLLFFNPTMFSHLSSALLQYQTAEF